MFPSILVPIVIFFGLTVFLANGLTSTALKGRGNQ
jgi:hypothetical protein